MEDLLQEMTDPNQIETLPMNESQMAQMRRNYPKNMKGGKEEWNGIEVHQNELNQELNSLEKQIKDLKKNELRFNF